MENWKKALLAGTALVGSGLLVAGEANAQSATGTFTSQTAARPDAASQLTTTSSANCTTTQVTVSNLTLTLTPAAGNYVYLQSFEVEVAPNTTGANSTAAWSSTNLTGSPAWLTAEQAGAAASPVTVGAPQVNAQFPTGLKATAPGTAVTLLPTATLASASVCAQAIWWQAPQ